MSGIEHFRDATYCRGCIHLDCQGLCLYILDMGHSRPCSPGEGCTVKLTQQDLLRMQREAKPPHVLDPQLVLIREMKDWWMEHGGTADELLARFPECKTNRKTIVADIRKWKRKKEAEQKND